MTQITQVTIALLLICSGAAQALNVVYGSQVPIKQELRRLAEAHGFELVVDDELLGDEAKGRLVEGDLRRQIQGLLDGFNSYIEPDEAGRIKRVIVSTAAVAVVAPPPGAEAAGEKASSDDRAASADVIVETVRQGEHHAVRVSLEGPDGQRVNRVLLLDTGASFVALPDTAIRPLKIDPSSLKQRRVQTANGKATARMGRLAALWIGSLRIENVEVGFLPRDKLGGMGLLGMNVLGRYQVTLDDENSKLRLSSGGKKNAEKTDKAKAGEKDDGKGRPNATDDLPPEAPPKDAGDSKLQDD